MPWPRLRLRLRTLMALIALVALGLGIDATRRRWADYQQLADYHAVLEELSRHEHERFLMSIQFATEGIEREGGEVDMSVGSFPMFLWHVERTAKDIDYHARMKRYYQSRW